MLSFLIRKMLNNKWMIACLLIGNILLIGTVSSVPLYSRATLQRMFIKDMEQYQLDTNHYPGLLELRYQFNYAETDRATALFEDIRDRVNEKIIKEFGLTVLDFMEAVNLQNMYFVPEVQREDKPKTRTLHVSGYSNLDQHVKITQGEMFSDQVVDGTVEAIITRRTLEDTETLLGETLLSTNFEFEGKPAKIKIVGIFENSLENDFYWTVSPTAISNRLFVSKDVLDQYYVENYRRDSRIEIVWQTLFQYREMDVQHVNKYIALDQYYQDYFGKFKDAFKFKTNFAATMSSYQQRSAKLGITLWVLQVPVFILLAFFIFMVSKQILVIEQNEISVIKSRGASRGQIILIYLMQGAIVCLFSYPIGLGLGVLICKILGASNGFLNLVQRSSLMVRLNRDAFVFSAIAVVISILTMIIPVVDYSRVTIVDYKRSKTGKTKKPLWQKLFLDVLALGISVYGYYSFGMQREYLAQSASDVQSIDPLLFLSSSLFIIGLGLLMLRLFPYLIKLIFLLGKSLWSPSLYASFLKVMRSTGEEQFIMIFLVVTVAIGIFDAKAARTINLNVDDKIRYQTGADLSFKEVWADNSQTSAGSSMGPPTDTGIGSTDIVYREPDFTRFTHFDEVDSIAKVLQDKVTVYLSEGRLDNTKIMAIQSNVFGETIWNRDDLFPIHINNYLNVLAKEPKAALLSRNFKDKYGYKIGDIINFRDTRSNYANCVVYGFVDYWPGYSQIERAKGTDGVISEKENWLIVANLNYIQSQWGVTPYEIWMKTNTPSNNFIYRYAEENNLRFASFKDAKADIVRGKNDPLLQGTNGVLTVGFIITLLVCTTGFLIYWILSIKSRVLQFGIFRAMGMSMRDVGALLVNEQIFITGIAIAIGVLVGSLSSSLFVPVIQLAYTASEQVIPLKIITQTEDYVRLFAVIGLMVGVCMVILGTIISKIKIAQALKLGED